MKVMNILSKYTKNDSANMCVGIQTTPTTPTTETFRTQGVGSSGIASTSVMNDSNLPTQPNNGFVFFTSVTNTISNDIYPGILPYFQNPYTVITDAERVWNTVSKGATDFFYAPYHKKAEIVDRLNSSIIESVGVEPLESIEIGIQQGLYNKDPLGRTLQSGREVTPDRVHKANKEALALGFGSILNQSIKFIAASKITKAAAKTSAFVKTFTKTQTEGLFKLVKDRNLDVNLGSKIIKKGDDIIAQGDEAIKELTRLKGIGFDIDLIQDSNVRKSILSLCN